MKSDEYWEDAALKREIAVQEGATDTIEEITKMYEDALSDIKSEVKTIQRNFQKRYGIDNDTAAYFLSRAQREDCLNSLIEALEAAPDDKARQRILDYIQLDGLSVRAYSARIERYRALETVIYSRIKKLAADETKTLKTTLKDAYKESYYGMIDDYAKGADVGISFTVIDDAAVDEVVGAKWHGARFSERIWKDTDRLAAEAQEIVARYIVSGRSLTKAAQELQESFGVSEYHAATLVRTEVSHAHARADLKAYDDLGIEKYRYLATLDYRTCETCGGLDGQTFDVSEAREGVNYPTMHPRCRCTTTMDMKYARRSMRDPITGKSGYTDRDMTYKEWRESLTPEQDAALKLAQKKDAHKTADKAQYGKYKHVLGTKNVPKSFDKWQNLKYNNSEIYENYKKIYSTATGYVEGGVNPKNGKPYQIITVNHVEIKGIPNSITQIENKNGGIDRNYYGGDGLQTKQISNHDHGNPKKHTFGENGEHAHDYIWENGNFTRTRDRNLTTDERKENGDIL